MYKKSSKPCRARFFLEMGGGNVCLIFPPYVAVTNSLETVKSKTSSSRPSGYDLMPRASTRRKTVLKPASSSSLNGLIFPFGYEEHIKENGVETEVLVH